MTRAGNRHPSAIATSFLCRAQLSSSPSSHTRTGCLSMKSAARRLASALRPRASVAALARVTCAPTTTTRTARALGAESVARRALLAASAAFVQRCSRPAGSARRCVSALSKRAVCSTNSANSTRTAPRRVRYAYASPRLLLPQNARVSSNSDLLGYMYCTADIPQRLHSVCTRTRVDGTRKGKAEWEAADYYSSDEDDFTDRTGDLERRRRARKRRFDESAQKAVTHTVDSLVFSSLHFSLLLGLLFIVHVHVQYSQYLIYTSNIESSTRYEVLFCSLIHEYTTVY